MRARLSANVSFIAEHGLKVARTPRIVSLAALVAIAYPAIAVEQPDPELATTASQQAKRTATNSVDNARPPNAGRVVSISRRALDLTSLPITAFGDR